MGLIKTITSITSIKSAEGIKLSYTYSLIDDVTGVITSNNERASFLLVDNTALEHVQALENFIKNRDILIEKNK